MPFLVDSHCHLNFPDFKDDLEQVVSRAIDSGVKYMQTICTEMAEFDEVYSIANRYDNIFCSVGVHPNDSGKQEIADVKELIQKAKLPKVIGIGETGLDYYYETSDKKIQQESFLNHIEAAQEADLPIIVHTRDADEDTARILENAVKRKQLRGVLHCFTSSRELALKAIDIGFYISFSGILTFKSAKNLHDLAKEIPLSRILVETDAPYLAPVPNRGKRNEPAFTADTARFLANLRQESYDKICEQTSKNFFTLFNKANQNN